MAQLHKRFTDRQVKEILRRYLQDEITRAYVQKILKIGKTRLFALIKLYRQNPDSFSLQYERQGRSIAPTIQKNIFKELAIEKKLIHNKDVPLHSYNYSYIQKRLQTHYDQTVSLPAIIRRAKQNWIHSTTHEIPAVRFEKALQQKQSLFRPFHIRPLYQSVKDIFYLRLERTADAYRTISLRTRQLKINGVNPGDVLNLRLYPLNAATSELRCWRKNTLLDIRILKNADLKGVHF
ncbi:MAG: hypothetical protein HY796_13670 [Elusimicrobia bacterium]|nr:hypothetical protein [Elusimicrobiota bacterium]